MCHTQKIAWFGETEPGDPFSSDVEGLRFDRGDPQRNVAVLPDIYGLTDFYKGYASWLSGHGARVFLTNPWALFGELPEQTRDAAFERRHKLKDAEHCDNLEKFLNAYDIDAIVGFCIGGNFVLELARRGYDGTIISVYPLPWGMANQDAIAPAFDYMPALEQGITVLMGEADYLAGPDNIVRLIEICAANEHLDLHLYPGSNHGFFTDIDGDDDALRENARNGIETVNSILF